MRKRDEEESKREYPEVSTMYDSGVPNDAHVWILKAGITPERASEQYGFGYSSKTGRVIIPILHNGKPTGIWIGRAIDGRKPKYLMPRGSVGACWYRLLGDRTPCVVVEDILSAIRVSEAGYSSMAVLGTSLSSTLISKIAERPVLGWFDNDEGGRKGWVSLRKACSPFGIVPSRIVSDRDPKTYNRREICKYIKDVT